MDKILRLPTALNPTLLVPALLALTLFALPISSSGKSISLVITLMAILASPFYRQQLAHAFTQPWFFSSLLLVSFIILSCFWSPASWSGRLFTLEKYSKLLYLPILAVGFTLTRTRHLGLLGFLLAMLLTCSLGILKFHGALPFIRLDPDFVFRNHVMTGFMVAFASYIALLLAYEQKDPAKRAAYVLMLLIYSYYLFFINQGRTGYVVDLILILILIPHIFSFKKTVLMFLLLVGGLGIVYFNHPAFHEGVNRIIQQTQDYHQNFDSSISSVGLRMQFHDFAHTLFLKEPLVGNGANSFKYFFHVLNPVPVWNHDLLEPHSQYWLIAVEQGLLGLLLLAFYFYTLFKAIWALASMRLIAIGMLVPFLLGNFTDSLLFYSGSGYCFLLFMAMCLGEQLAATKPLSTS